MVCNLSTAWGSLIPDCFKSELTEKSGFLAEFSSTNSEIVLGLTPQGKFLSDKEGVYLIIPSQANMEICLFYNSEPGW